jgi:hypothetical protein
VNGAAARLRVLWDVLDGVDGRLGGLELLAVLDDGVVTNRRVFADHSETGGRRVAPGPGAGLPEAAVDRVLVTRLPDLPVSMRTTAAIAPLCSCVFAVQAAFMAAGDAIVSFCVNIDKSAVFCREKALRCLFLMHWLPSSV